MSSSNPLSANRIDLGGHNGSCHLLTFDEVQKMKKGDKIAGSWKIFESKKATMPKASQRKWVLVTLKVFDDYNKTKDGKVDEAKLLEVRIWKHPKTEPIPEKDDIVIIEQMDATIKTFNGRNQVHVYYNDVECLRANEKKNEHIELSDESSDNCEEDDDLKIMEEANNEQIPPCQPNDIRNAKRKRDYENDERVKPRKRTKLLSQFTEISLLDNRQKQKITNGIKQLFAWMVHRFDAFEQIQCEHSNPLNPPRLNGQDEFMRIVITKMSQNDLRLGDCAEVYASNGDVIVDNMESENRIKTKRALEDGRFNDLACFAKIILQRMNKIICKKQKKETFLHKKLNGLWHKFPRQRDYEQLPSMIVFRILSFSLTLKQRESDVLDLEQREFEEICEKNAKYTKCYAQCYVIRLCPLCFSEDVRLKYSVNTQINGQSHVNVCDECRQQIEAAIALWTFYDAMLHWDDGWDLLLKVYKNDKTQYAQMMAVMCAILFRQFL